MLLNGNDVGRNIPFSVNEDKMTAQTCSFFFLHHICFVVCHHFPILMSIFPSSNPQEGDLVNLTSLTCSKVPQLIKALPGGE